MPQTSTYHFLVTYNNKEDINMVLRMHAGAIQHYAYILHNKDNTDDHYHILLKLYRSRRTTDVCSWFKGLPQNTFNEVPIDLTMCVKYLTHDDPKSLLNEEKAHYNVEDIVCDVLSFWTDLETSEGYGDKGTDIIDDLLNGVPYSIMYKKYGREFIINCDKYAHFASIIRAESMPIEDNRLYTKTYGNKPVQESIDNCNPEIYQKEIK